MPGTSPMSHNIELLSLSFIQRVGFHGMCKNKCLMDIICKEGKTFVELHDRKVLYRHAEGLWRGLSYSGLTVWYDPAFICQSAPSELLRVKEVTHCQRGSGAWEPWLWLSSSSLEWKLLSTMTGSPGPSGLSGKVLKPKIPSVICFPS